MHKGKVKHNSPSVAFLDYLLFRNFVFFVLHFSTFTFVLSSIASAEVGDFFSQFHPSFTVQEEYTDNIYLFPTDRKGDFITTISPGISFSTSPLRATTPAQISQTPTDPTGINLNYQLGLAFYARENQNDYISHNGTLDTWYTYNQRLTLRLRENFIQSEENREWEYTPGALGQQNPLGTQRGRSVYSQNVFGPSVDYQFGPNDRVSINYRNTIYQNQNPAYEDSQENALIPRLIYWFNIRNGITLEYGYIRGDFERSPDFVVHLARGRYTYQFNPRTSLFVENTFRRRDFDPPSTDSEINNPSMGIDHAFSPMLTGRVQVGYFWQNPEGRPSTGGFSCDVGLTKSEERTSYTLSFQGGYREDYFTAQNLGFAKYYRAIASIRHTLAQRVTLGVSGAIERAEYASDQKDWIYSARGYASFQLLRWLSLSLEASHRGDESNVDTQDYIENRVLLRLSATL